MDNFISFINENITLFDIIFLIFIIYFSIQCLINGFVLSLISFLKWIMALIITIKLFPIVEPYASDYIDMDKYAFVVGLGIFIYVLSLFILIMLGKSLGRLSYAGIGSVDKIFGFFFGIFKGYVFVVCIFVIADKFELYKKFDLSTNNSVFFPSVEWGRKLLIDNFQNLLYLENYQLINYFPTQQKEKKQSYLLINQIFYTIQTCLQLQRCTPQKHNL
jgi:membrane protein required for colicin V production